MLRVFALRVSDLAEHIEAELQNSNRIQSRLYRHGVARQRSSILQSLEIDSGCYAD